MGKFQRMKYNMKCREIFTEAKGTFKNIHVISLINTGRRKTSVRNSLCKCLMYYFMITSSQPKHIYLPPSFKNHECFKLY